MILLKTRPEISLKANFVLSHCINALVSTVQGSNGDPVGKRIALLQIYSRYIYKLP